MSSEKTTIALEYPVESNGVTIRELAVRRPKVRDILNAKKSKSDQSEQEILILATLCEVAPQVIQDLDLTDYAKVQDAFAGFRGRTTEA